MSGRRDQQPPQLEQAKTAKELIKSWKEQPRWDTFLIESIHPSTTNEQITEVVDRLLGYRHCLFSKPESRKYGPQPKRAAVVEFESAANAKDGYHFLQGDLRFENKPAVMSYPESRQELASATASNDSVFQPGSFATDGIPKTFKPSFPMPRDLKESEHANNADTVRKSTQQSWTQERTASPLSKRHSKGSQGPGP